MGAVEFREADHSYWKDGRRVPGVTTILRPLYGDLRFVQQDLLDWKSELGQAVHRAVELHVLDDLVYDSLDPAVAAYFAQYLLFEVESGFKPTDTEVRVLHPLGYAGTLDLLGTLPRGVGALRKNALVDIKTTAALSPAVKLQTAAYQQAWVASNGDMTRPQAVPHRYALRLTPDKYRLEPYQPSTDAADFAGFLGLFKAYQWCSANGATVGDFSHVQ